MCEGFPQVAILAVHLRAHRYRRVSRQETGFYVDLLVYQGANWGRCDGGGRSGAAPPPQPTCSRKKATQFNNSTFITNLLKIEGQFKKQKARQNSVTQDRRVEGEG